MKRILLISANMEKKPFALFPLGLAYLRTALKNAGYECGILDFAHLPFTRDVLVKYLNNYNPLLIGISIRNIDNCCMKKPRSFVKPVFQTLQWIREWHPDIPVVLGGAGFSLLPRPWLETVDADYGIVGNGIAVFIQLADELLRRDKKKKHRKRPLLLYSRLAKGPAFPSPERGGFIHPLNPRVSMRHNVRSMTGCSARCSYCSYPFLEGRKIRPWSSEWVREEIREMVEHGIDSFDFVDSVFNNSLSHAQAVGRSLAEARFNVRWGCFMSPGKVSPALIQVLKAGGCNFVEWGADSGSETILRNLNKQFRPRDIVNAVQLCREYGLPFSICLLFGSPGETMTTVRETLALMDKLNIEDGFGLTGIRVLPNTDIYNRYCRHMPYQSLLRPRFYFSNQLELPALYREFAAFRRKYPRWILL